MNVKVFAGMLLLTNLGQAFAASPGLLFNVSTSSTQLIINSMTSNRTYPNAGIKIRSSNYSLTGIGSECTLLANGYCTFPVSDSLAHHISISGTGRLDINLCLNAKGPLSCQAYNNVPLSPTPSVAKYLYVTNYDTSAPVKICSLDNDGEVVSCSTTGIGLINIPTVGITINNTAAKAYLSLDDNNNIFQCDINTMDGTFSSCVQTTMANTDYTTGFYGSLITNSNHSFAYLVDDGSNGFANNILICPINGGAISSICSTPAFLSNSGAGESIAINQNGDTVYVADYSDHGVYVCGISGGGATVGSCILKTGDGTLSFGSIAGVALNPSETLIYVTAYNTGNIYACTTTANGTNHFDHCMIAGNGMPDVAGMTINAAGTKAYIGGFTGNLFTCSINSDGSFQLPCTLTAGFNLAMSVALGY